MKKRMLLFLILSMFINMSFVNAECTEEELNELKEQAEDIEIIYEHMGGIETEEGTSYNYFEVTIENIPNDFYIVTEDIKEISENSKITLEMTTGKQEIDIYSTKCEEKLDSIDFKLPRYNIYYEDPLCEGIDGKDFALCGKYYETYVSYDDFQTRVKNYRINNKIDEKIVNKKQDKTQNDNKIEKLLNLILKYKLNIAISFSIIILVILILLLINKKKKRGVLK